MSTTSYARRQKRRLNKGSRAVPMNIVSMIDIFAILVFFLLINYWQVDVAVTQVKDVQLPESVSLANPKQSVVIAITTNDILVQGAKVISIADALQGKDEAIPSVEAALQQEATRVPAVTTVTPAAGQPGPAKAADPNSRSVIIMGDKTIPYHLLKRVMLSCSQARFANVSLAVLEKKTGQP